jgi:hypothetical protein
MAKAFSKNVSIISIFGDKFVQQVSPNRIPEFENFRSE